MVPPLAGESADVLARTLADPMSKLLGQPVLVKRAGELDSSYRSVPHGAPDGYTLEIGNLDSHRYTMYGRSYDFLRDLMPVALLPSVPAWIVARRELPATDLRELLAWLGTNSDKAWPGRLGFGTPGKASAGIVGAGTTGHICGTYLQDATSTHIQFVPYWGEEAMLQGLVRGQIDVVCGQATKSLAMVRSGQIKVYTVMAKARWFAMPEIPTADEMGLRGIYASYWYGFWVPAGTPNDIITKLNAAAIEAMTDPAVRRRIADQGMEIPAREQQSPAALDTFQRAEIAKWCEAMVGRGRSYRAVVPLCSGRRAAAT
jgi:tripartite-type tricarboxylate transporter receptor subunit TctC